MHHKVKSQHPHQAPIIPLGNQLVSKKGNNKIALPMKNMICLVQTKNILYLKADSNYTHVIMYSGVKHTCSMHLKKFEDRLGTEFLRVHQSYLVQKNYISKFKTSENILELESGHPIPVSRKNKLLVNNYLKQWML